MCSRIIEGYQRHMSDARKKCLSRILRIYWHNTCPVRSATKEPASLSWLNAVDGNGSDTSVECIDFHSKIDHFLSDNNMLYKTNKDLHLNVSQTKLS